MYVQLLGAAWILEPWSILKPVSATCAYDIPFGGWMVLSGFGRILLAVLWSHLLPLSDLSQCRGGCPLSKHLVSDLQSLWTQWWSYSWVHPYSLLLCGLSSLGPKPERGEFLVGMLMESVHSRFLSRFWAISGSVYWQWTQTVGIQDSSGMLWNESSQHSLCETCFLKIKSGKK